MAINSPIPIVVVVSISLSQSLLYNTKWIVCHFPTPCSNKRQIQWSPHQPGLFLQSTYECDWGLRGWAGWRGSWRGGSGGGWNVIVGVSGM